MTLAEVLDTPRHPVNGREAYAELAEALWPAERATLSRQVRCRHCGTPNRVRVARAVLEPERHRCGSCRGALFLGKEEPLVGLPPEAYQHSLDRRSLSALRSIPGVPELMRWLLSELGDRSAQLVYMADSIRCSEDQFPELLRLMETARRRLDLDLHPTIYLGESPHMNAMATGVGTPVVVVRSALLDQMNDGELVAVLGHELGHLHSDHPLYQSVAQSLLRGGASASLLVFLLGAPIQRALLWWSRCAELTADRAALLASRDIAACINMMLIFAGGNRPGTHGRTRMRVAPFIQQCRELARMHSSGSLEGALSGYLVMDRTHPHLASRVMWLIQWVEHGNYLELLSGNYARRTEPPVPRVRSGARRRPPALAGAS